MSRNPDVLCSILRNALWRIIADFEAFDPTRRLIIVETDRSREKQEQDFLAGRSQRDGVHRLSMHQVQELHGEMAAHAVDFGVTVKGQYAQDRSSYEPLMNIAERYGLRSGLDWDGDHILDAAQRAHAFVDAPHVECATLAATGPRSGSSERV